MGVPWTGRSCHRKSTRIAKYLPDADVNAEEDWARYVDWLLERQTLLRDAIASVGGVPSPTTPLTSSA